MRWYDCHCHMSNLAQMYEYPVLLKEALKKDINGWLSCALSKEEVHWHQLNRHEKIKWSAGIHPVYDEGTALTMDDLEKLIKEKQIFALGEIGLDKRNRDLHKQIALLRDQLSLARYYHLPCVFHVVGHYDVFYKILSEQPVRGIWHGFYASPEVLQMFIKCEITFLIGYALVKSLKHPIINAIIKYGNYMLETDSPFNTRKNNNNSNQLSNPLLELIRYASIISKLNGVKLESLQRDLYNNSIQYFI